MRGLIFVIGLGVGVIIGSMVIGRGENVPDQEDRAEEVISRWV